ncbi:MAG: universal stress protein, partial [Alphaproteobacteria bacterium]|nr:universal stress protein [Alphaproteobacteria bacterium]
LDEDRLFMLAHDRGKATLWQALRARADTDPAFAAARQRLSPLVRIGGVVQAVAAAAERFSPDLLVVGTHGRTGVAHALLGSVAGTLLADPPVDVLAIRAW